MGAGDEAHTSPVPSSVFVQDKLESMAGWGAVGEGSIYHHGGLRGLRQLQDPLRGCQSESRADPTF